MKGLTIRVALAALAALVAGCPPLPPQDGIRWFMPAEVGREVDRLYSKDPAERALIRIGKPSVRPLIETFTVRGYYEKGMVQGDRAAGSLARRAIALNHARVSRVLTHYGDPRPPRPPIPRGWRSWRP